MQKMKNNRHSAREDRAAAETIHKTGEKWVYVGISPLQSLTDVGESLWYYSLACTGLLAFCLSSFRKILPEALFGITSLKTIPPRRCLCVATLLLTNA